MAVTGYQIVEYSRQWMSSDHLVYGGVQAPTGKVCVGGGFKFTYSDGRSAGVRVRENCHISKAAFSSGTQGWSVCVEPDGYNTNNLEGTLYIYAICVD